MRATADLIKKQESSKIKNIEMKFGIKTLSLLSLIILFISSSYAQMDIVKQSKYNLNLIKEKKFDELSNSLYQFNYKDTFFLSKINKILKNDSLIFKVDTTEYSYIVSISILPSSKYDTFTSNNVLSFYYNKNLKQYCILYVSNVPPSKVEFKEDEIDEILQQFKKE